MRQLSRIIVQGRVQGVGYRAWMARLAAAHEIDGWVRNREDGTVEAVLAGDGEHVRALIAECRRGPASSAVTDIEVSPWDESVGTGFKIVG